MKAADAHLDAASRSGFARSSACGNWFDCTPTSITIPRPLSRSSRQTLRTDARVRFVKGMDLDLDVIAEDVPMRAIAARARRAPPAN